MPEKSLAELMAEQEKRKKETAAARARARKKTETGEKGGAGSSDGGDGGLRVQPRIKSPQSAVHREKISRTERHYTDPVTKIIQDGKISLESIPIEVLRGILYLFEGRVNWKKDKKKLFQEIRRYLKYEENVARLIETVKLLFLHE